MNLDFCHRLPVRIYYEDTDAGGVVYHANYLKYYERGRTEWLRTQGVGQEALKSQHQMVFVVTEANLHFLRPALFDQALEVVTRICAIKGSRLLFAQHLVSGSGTTAEVILNRAEISIACVDTQTWRSQRLSHFFMLFGASVALAAEHFSPSATLS